MTSSAIEAVLDRMHTVLGDFYTGVASRADMAGLLASDVAWHVPGSNAIAGDYRGVDEVIGYFTRRRNLAAGTFRMTPATLLSAAASTWGCSPTARRLSVGVSGGGRLSGFIGSAEVGLR